MKNFFTKYGKYILGFIGTLSTLILIAQGCIGLYDRLNHKTAILSYSAQRTKVFDDENIVTNTANVYIKDAVSSFGKFSGLWVYSVKLKNTGNKDLKYSDFYEKDPLRIEVGNYNLYGAFITNSTKDYIDAKIDKIKDGTIYIKFNTIEPNDSIYVNILKSDKNSILNIYAKTKEFDTIPPMDYKTAEDFGASYEIREKLRPKNFMDYLPMLWVLLLLGLLIFIIYSEVSKQKKQN